jgi:hypothetical protein
VSGSISISARSTLLGTRAKNVWYSELVKLEPTVHNVESGGNYVTLGSIYTRPPKFSQEHNIE